MQDFNIKEFIFGFFVGFYGTLFMYYLVKGIDYMETKMKRWKMEKFDKVIIKEYKPK